MLFLKDDINHENYASLLQYAYKFCDMLTLQIPNHNKMVINEKNHSGNLGLEIGYCEMSDDPLYNIYFENSIRLVEKLFSENIIKTFYDTEYLTSVYSSERKIYAISMNQKVIDNLVFAGSLFSWKFPFLPEDLSLFIKGKCWLQSIAHEETCWIYDNSKNTTSMLKKMGLKIWQIPDETIPTFKETG